MSAAGNDTSNNTNSTPTFVSALVTGVITFTVYTVIFWLLHSRFQGVYQPRTLLAPESKRPRVLPKGLFGWFRGVLSEPDIRVGEMNGADAYFFLRYIKFLVILLLPYWLISWPILMVVHALAPNQGLTGLDHFSYGNVGTAHNIRHIADLVVVLVLIFWTLFMLHHEFRAFLRIRQAYLNSAAHAILPRSRTVMLNNLPKGWVDEARLRELASFVDGPVEAVWLPRKVKNMEKLFDARNKECAKLEAGEAKAQKMAVKNVKKNTLPPGGEEAGDPVARHILQKKRPSHRLGPLGLIGRKVDTLEYSPQFIREKDEALEAERARYDEYPLLSSAFIRFGRQADAHAFARAVKKQPGARKIGCAVEVVPDDIIWSNLTKSFFMRKLLTFISWAISMFLILTFAIYVAFVGGVSKIKTVCNDLSFLNWICKLPTAVVGIIQGILPPVLLAILFMLVPIVLRKLVTIQGEPRHSDVERKLWYRMWAFLLFDGFLVVGLASGILPALSNFKQFASTASSIPTKLATSLPTSSIFFLTFILTNTFTAAASTNSRAVPVALSKLAFLFRGKTPRKAYAYDYKMGSISLSTTWPSISLLGCIAIVYPAMQPITCAFAVVGLFLIYVTYKYLLIWVMDQPDYLETGGLYYVGGLRAVFMSLYVLELVMTGLFFLLKGDDGKITKIGIISGSIMAAMVVLTALYQIWLERRYTTKYLFLDAPSDAPGSMSAEALWPGTPSGPLPDAPGTLALDADLHARYAVDNGAGADYGNTSGLHPRAFDNPAAWKRQPIIWIADDANGLGVAEVARLTSMNVAASSAHATMTEAGKVEITRGPPDEAWYGGKVA